MPTLLRVRVCNNNNKSRISTGGDTRTLCFLLLVIISTIKCRNPSICLHAMAGSSQRCTRVLHKLEHRKSQLSITKQVLHLHLGQTPGNRPQKTDGTPSLGGFKLNQTWCWATQSKLLLFWALQILLTQITLCVTLGPKPVSDQPGQVLVSCCLVLKALSPWPGSSSEQGPHPCVCEQILCSGRSSRSCLNTNNNDKVKGKNTVYHLSLMGLFFF